MQKKKTTKCVLIIDYELPIGLIANTATILGLTLGKKTEDIIGPDVIDASGNVHLGITQLPIPVLKSTKDDIKELVQTIREKDFNDIMVVNFSNIAQCSLDYNEYIKESSKTSSNDFEYLGVALYGDIKKINKLTGRFALLR